MTKQEAAAQIAEKTAQAHKLIDECEVLADEHELSFSFDIVYGMGGQYIGGEENEYTCNNWHPSSVGC